MNERGRGLCRCEGAGGTVYGEAYPNACADGRCVGWGGGGGDDGRGTGGRMRSVVRTGRGNTAGHCSDRPATHNTEKHVSLTTPCNTETRQSNNHL